MSNSVWKRFKPTADVKFQSIYSDNENGLGDVAGMVTSEENIEYLTKLIIDRADPLRNGSSLVAPDTIRPRIRKLLDSWKNVGKFDHDTIQFEGKTLLIRAVSPTALLDHYNTEFVKAFAESILPTSDLTKVTSITNPDGLFAQQERIIKINSKPVPFYEAAIYKRLNVFTLEQRIDETEMPFFRMDHNPRMIDAERKKRDVDRTQEPTYLDRVGLSYRMKPDYQSTM